MVVVERYLTTFTHGFKRGKVNGIVDVGMRGEHFVEFGFVGDVAGVVFRSFAAD